MQKLVSFGKFVRLWIGFSPRVMTSREVRCLCVWHCRPRPPSYRPQLGSLSSVMLSLPRSFAIASRLYCQFSLSSPIGVTRLLRLQAQPQTLGCRQGRRRADPRLYPGTGSSLEPVCSLRLAPLSHH